MTRPQIPTLYSERLELTVPGPEAAGRVARFFVDNRKHLAPSSPPQPETLFTEPFWVERLKQPAVKDE